MGHDLTPARQEHDPAAETYMYDPDALVGVDEIAARLEGTTGWRIDVHEVRPRPAGAVSTHHVHDVVLRAVRSGDDPVR